MARSENSDDFSGPTLGGLREHRAFFLLLDRFTRFLRIGPARSTPQADTAELAAKRARLRAAFMSRAISKLQSSQRNLLSAKASVSLMTPQQEVLLDAYQRSVTMTRAPY